MAAALVVTFTINARAADHGELLQELTDPAHEPLLRAGEILSDLSKLSYIRYVSVHNVVVVEASVCGQARIRSLPSHTLPFTRFFARGFGTGQAACLLETRHWWGCVCEMC